MHDLRLQGYTRAIGQNRETGRLRDSFEFSKVTTNYMTAIVGTKLKADGSLLSIEFLNAFLFTKMIEVQFRR